MVFGSCASCFGTGGAFAQIGPSASHRSLRRPTSKEKLRLSKWRRDLSPQFVCRRPSTQWSSEIRPEFQVEHSDREPELVFVKAISTKATETNLLISTTSGQQVSLLLVNRGETPSGDPRSRGFLAEYEPAGGFFVAPSGFPFALVGETVPLSETEQASAECRTECLPSWNGREPGVLNRRRPGKSLRCCARGHASDGLDKLLEQQENAPLPTLYGEHIT